MNPSVGVQDKLLLVLDLFAFSAAGIVISTLYFLIFLPPAAYRRHLQRAAETVG